MDASFWHERWTLGEIAFHEGQANSFLVKHFGALNLMQGSRVFVPLCGKTRDIAWLLAQGYRVVGAELSEAAIKELFEELDIEPSISIVSSLVYYQGENIEIWVGDIFDITAAELKPVDAIYDRAALVALPESMRHQYTTHLVDITECAPQLMICFEYDQSVISGPPFSITPEDVSQHYDGVYSLTLLERCNVNGGLKKKVVADEIAWLLTAK